MPLSFTTSHAVADGFHVSCFFEELQQAFDQPEIYLGNGTKKGPASLGD